MSKSRLVSKYARSYPVNGVVATDRDAHVYSSDLRKTQTIPKEYKQFPWNTIGVAKEGHVYSTDTRRHQPSKVAEKATAKSRLIGKLSSSNKHLARQKKYGLSVPKTKRTSHK